MNGGGRRHTELEDNFAVFNFVFFLCSCKGSDFTRVMQKEPETPAVEESWTHWLSNLQGYYLFRPGRIIMRFSCGRLVIFEPR